MLDTELQYFDQNRRKWLKNHHNKYALVQGTIVHGFYDTRQNAYKVGCEVWGISAFLIKQVLRKDEVMFMSRFSPVIEVTDSD